MTGDVCPSSRDLERALSLPMVEAFHVSAWYVLQYYEKAIDSSDLLSLRGLITLSLNNLCRSEEAADGIEAFELLLRMALRDAKWLRVRCIETQYSCFIRVASALEELNITPIAKYVISDTRSEGEQLVRVLDGKAIFRPPLGCREEIREILRTARVHELQQLDRCVRYEDGPPSHNHSAVHYTSAGNHSYGGESITGVQTAGRSSWNAKGCSSRLLPEKEDLIDRILSVSDEEGQLASAWDRTVGPICCVHQLFRDSILKISELIHEVTAPSIRDDICKYPGSAPAGCRSSDTTILKIVSKLMLRQSSDLRGPWMLWPQACRIVGGESSGGVVPLLASSPKALVSFREAIELCQRLCELRHAKTLKQCSADIVLEYHSTIEKKLALLDSRPLTADDCADETARRKRTYSVTTSADVSDGCALSVEELLHHGGLLYEHLLHFLPKYRWFACAELLVPLLQAHKRWDLVNMWLRKLLDEPVYVVSTSFGTPTFPMYYRYEKRGKWWNLLAQGHAHLGDKEGAFQLLEKRQSAWREQDSPQRYLRMERAEELPVSIQRRARLLCALFRVGRGRNSGSQKAVALYNAVGEHHRLHFYRRSDRIAIERTLLSLQSFLRRWTPTSPNLSSFTAHMLSAPETTIPGDKDHSDATFWGDTKPSTGCFSAEKCVLRWFGLPKVHESGDGTCRPSSWTGLHCKGRWVNYLGRLLLWDAFHFDPDALPRGNESMTGSVPEFVWLSPVQETPLDLETSSISFQQRRRHIIEKSLRFFERCSRDVLIYYVRQRCVSENSGACEDNSKQKSNSSSLKEPLHANDVGADFISGDENFVPLGQPVRSPNSQEKDGPTASFIPAEQLLDPEEFPLFDLLQAVPQGALCALLRCLYLPPPEDGYSVHFDSFPDLVLWREVPSQPDGYEFKLVEVLGPNESLSEKQISTIDTLLRCKFDVTVAHVTDVDEGKKKSNRSKGRHDGTEHGRGRNRQDGAHPPV
ncbi:VRR-NUC domain containing protein, putative [Trypanosoma equiperdum]|uniref:Fanconi-associated nuclease n=1 Tax=Trypanosoma equiperdum TaxID=5694 RepID=A0A1G4IJD6_TRYEQ|nr:VRR-NUC domain containing protein, putative [Trypanosoma equiperdum]